DVPIASDRAILSVEPARPVDPVFSRGLPSLVERFVRANSKQYERTFLVFLSEALLLWDQRHARPTAGEPKGHPFGVGDQMTLRAPLAAIRGIRPCFLPPKMARTEQLSMTAHERLISPARPSSLSSVSQMACHTPACCQSRSRRQQVMPHPQPSS